MKMKSDSEMLAVRERFRDEDWQKRDPIYRDRLLWRSHSFRHMVHLLPGQSILELGCGQGFFTRQLQQVSRVDYGFLITELQDGADVHNWEANGDQDYHLTATEDGTIVVYTALTSEQTTASQTDGDPGE